MSETNKANAVAFHTKAIFEGDIDGASRPLRRNPLTVSTTLSSETSESTTQISSLS